MLSAYFQASETEEVRSGQLAWWMDELQDWALEQVVWGLRKWNADNPNKRPTPGHITGLLKAERGRAHVAKKKAEASRPDQKPVEDTPMTDQQRAKFNETLASFVGVHRVPKPQSEAQTQRNIQDAKRQMEPKQ